MKRILLLSGLALVALGVWLLVRLPVLVEQRLLGVLQPPPYPIREDTQQWYRTLLVADLHADTLLWKRDLLERAKRGHVDVPRLQSGGVALQVLSAVTKVPQGLNYERNDATTDQVRWLALVQLWPWPTWNSPFARARYQAEKLRAAAERAPDQLKLVRSRADLEEFLAFRARRPQLVASVLGVEGLHALEGRLENLEVLFSDGYRVMGLTHFFDNELGGSAHGVAKGGLTDFGRAVVETIERKGMIVDLAHASPRLIQDVLAIARRPVIVSHTGVRGTCDNVRNLSDDQLRAIAAKGGLIGIGYWDKAVCDVSLQGIVRAILHAVNVVGAQHVALGSDFDGATITPFDTTGVPQIAQALRDAGLSLEQVAAIMGGNVVRLLRELLP